MTATLDILADVDAFVANPYAFYKELRDHHPAYRHEQTGLWFISRFQDVERAATDYANFSSSRGNVIVDNAARVGKTLGSIDPPRHDVLRMVIQRSLAPSRTGGLVATLREETEAQLARFADTRSCDLVSDIARPILFGALGRLLGLGREESAEATRLTQNLFHKNDGLLGQVLAPEEFGEIFRFLEEQLERRKQGAVGEAEDLFSVLLQMQAAGGEMTDAEIVANLSTVLLAGNASIGHFFPNLMHALWLHPDQRRMVRENPALITAAIEESVRWDTSTQAFARQVMTDVDMHGVTIPAGSRAVALFASANRDERVIDEPDRFNIERKRVRHFGFGMGPHVCAGANVARGMLREIVDVLLPALGEYEVDIGNAARVRHLMVRGFINFPISWA